VCGVSAGEIRNLAYHKERMALSKNGWLRKFGGYLCLLGVMLIYAPQGLLAWWTGTGACCKSSYCPIPEHHRLSKPPASTEHDGMECQHSTPGFRACTMSCCHEKENALMAPVTFLLEQSAELHKTTLVSRLSLAGSSKNSVQSFEPLSPPPRLA
jgi:hypothetical protein